MVRNEIEKKNNLKNIKNKINSNQKNKNQN
jgi:hypothetical protein